MVATVGLVAGLRSLQRGLVAMPRWTVVRPFTVVHLLIVQPSPISHSSPIRLPAPISVPRVIQALPSSCPVLLIRQ